MQRSPADQRTLTAHKRRSFFLHLSCLVLLVGACGGGSDKATTAAASYRIRAGLNDPGDPTIAVLQFMPASLSVVKGSTLTWAWSGNEPHSVTFLPPGQLPPSPSEAKAFAAPSVPAGGVFDGTTLANSGLQPVGAASARPFTLKFTTEGTYKYYCVIHPSMEAKHPSSRAGRRPAREHGIARRAPDTLADPVEDAHREDLCPARRDRYEGARNRRDAITEQDKRPLRSRAVGHST